MNCNRQGLSSEGWKQEANITFAVEIEQQPCLISDHNYL